jgi:Fe-S cluster assembly protein SufD
MTGHWTPVTGNLDLIMATMRLEEPKVTADFLPGFGEQEFTKLSELAEGRILAGKRQAAFDSYRAIRTPTVRDEEWRRTDPARLELGRFARMPDLQPVGAGPAGPWDAEFDVVIGIDDRGYSITDRTGLLKSGGCSVLPLAKAAETMADVLDRYFMGAALPPVERKFTQLNSAFWNFGLLVHVPSKAVIEKGLLLRYGHGVSGRAVLPRLLVVVEDGAELRMVEHFQSPDEAVLACIDAREMYVGRNASLKLTSIQEWGEKTVHIGEDWARVGRDGRIEWNTLTLGGAISKMTVGCDVAAQNANAYLTGLFFAHGDQHFDQRTIQLHSSPDTYSNLLYKGAVKDKGVSVYQGIIKAKPGAIRVDAYQMNNNLVLNEGARADSLPGLEIDADDLKCSHGATSGTLDDEMLFYLRSRGIGEVEARRLIVSGFFEDVVARIPYATIQGLLREQIEKKINE